MRDKALDAPAPSPSIPLAVGLTLLGWAAIGCFAWWFDGQETGATFGRAAVGHLWTLPVCPLALGLGWVGTRPPIPRRRGAFILKRGVIALGLPSWLLWGPAAWLAKAGYDLSRVTVGVGEILSAGVFVAVIALLNGAHFSRSLEND